MVVLDSCVAAHASRSGIYLLRITLIPILAIAQPTVGQAGEIYLRRFAASNSTPKNDPQLDTSMPGRPSSKAAGVFSRSCSNPAAPVQSLTRQAIMKKLKVQPFASAIACNVVFQGASDRAAELPHLTRRHDVV